MRVVSTSKWYKGATMAAAVGENYYSVVNPGLTCIYNWDHKLLFSCDMGFWVFMHEGTIYMTKGMKVYVVDQVEWTVKELHVCFDGSEVRDSRASFSVIRHMRANTLSYKIFGSHNAVSMSAEACVILDHYVPSKDCVFRDGMCHSVKKSMFKMGLGGKTAIGLNPDLALTGVWRGDRFVNSEFIFHWAIGCTPRPEDHKTNFLYIGQNHAIDPDLGILYHLGLTDAEKALEKKRSRVRSRIKNLEDEITKRRKIIETLESEL